MWRVVMHPTFHDDVAVTVTDLDAGGWIELRVVPAAARAWAMATAGLGPWMQGAPPSPRAVEAVLSAAQIDSVAASMPAYPFFDVPIGGRDGMTVEHEALVGAEVFRNRSWSPGPRSATVHHRQLVALCTLAAQTVADATLLTPLHAVAGYLSRV